VGRLTSWLRDARHPVIERFISLSFHQPNCIAPHLPACGTTEWASLPAPTLLTPAALFSKKEIIIRQRLADQLLVDLHRCMEDRAGQFSARSIAVVDMTIACTLGG
jgi:hypothetical protein